MMASMIVVSLAVDAVSQLPVLYINDFLLFHYYLGYNELSHAYMSIPQFHIVLRPHRHQDRRSQKEGHKHVTVAFEP